MKYFFLIIFPGWIGTSTAQVLTKVKEEYIAERTIGQTAFIQADINGDGEIEFLADANNLNDVILGKISGNDIEILKFISYPGTFNSVGDVRYEDSNGDGHMEVYVLLDDVGLIQYDTSTFLPLDTFTFFDDFDSYRTMLLVDMDHDEIQEWVILDESDGIVVVNPETLEILWSNPALTGKNLLIENLDTDPALELVLIKNTMISIIDVESLVVEHTISELNIKQVEALDLDADNDLELVYQFGDNIVIYDHYAKTTIDQYEIDFPFSIDYFIPYNLDGDPALELLLTSETFSRMVEVNTFPLVTQDQYPVEGERDLGFYLGRSIVTGEPDDLLFTLGDYQVSYAGLVRYKSTTHTARLTNIRGEPNATLSHTSADGSISYLMTRPAGARDQVINVLSADSFSTVKLIRGEDIFVDPNISLDPWIFTFSEKGKSDDILVFSNKSHLCFYNLRTDQHNEFYTYSFSKFLLDDLEFDGSTELITINDNGISVYKNQTGYDFEFAFTTIPISSSYSIRTAQLNLSRNKEILAFANRNLYVFDGATGGQIRYISNITAGNISDIYVFSDGKGKFYIALLDPTHIYLYDFTNQQPGISFRYSGASFSRGAINGFNALEQDTIIHYLASLADTLKLFSIQGDLLFKSEYQKPIFDDQSRIIIDDFDQDYLPDIITSSQHKFTEYEFTGSGEFIQPFYLTDIFPKDSMVLHRPSSFLLQFSEAVSIPSITSNIFISSRNLGNLNYTIEEVGDHQIKITHDPLPETSDSITITIGGGLQSKLFRHLDTNYDGLTLRDNEDPIVETYLLDPAAAPNQVSIEPVQPLPNIVYTKTNRHIPFNISSQPDQDRLVPISSVHYGILSDTPPAQQLALPADSVYDESAEVVLIPLNTFLLGPGDYTYYVVAHDFLGEISDTLFFSVRVIEESGFYDKNQGGNNYRSFEIPNRRITSNFKKVKEISHASFNKISHVVGGNQNMYYTELPSGSSEGSLHSINLSTFESNWEIPLPMYSRSAPVHLNNGILYTSNNFQGPAEPMIGMYDIESGQSFLKRTYNSNGLNVHSPITDEKYLILPDGENNGVYCLDRWTGKERWFQKTGSSNPSLGAPAIFGDMVYSVYASFIQAIDIESGVEVWSVDIDDYASFVTAGIIIDTINAQVIWSGDDHLYAFDAATGNLNWRVPSDVNYEQPVLYNNEIFHFSNDSLRVYAAATGARLRQKKPASFFDGQPVAANGKLFIPFFSTFEAWDAKTLATIWTEEIGVNDISIIDQYLILASGNRLHIYESLDQCCNPTITWTEVLFYGFFGEATTLKYTYDSIPVIQNGNTYYEILSSEIETGGNWQRTGILIRQQDNKIYQAFSFGEEIIMDFNLQINDIFTSHTGVDYTVMAIDSVELENGEFRKRLEIGCDAWSGDPFYWIEGIGSTAGLALYDYTCFFDVGGALLCLSQNETLLFDHPEYNTCWLQIVSTDDLQRKGISFSPNPATDEISIADPDRYIDYIRIFDSAGQILHKGNEIFIRTSSFNPGYYMIVFELKDGSRISEKLIKI